MFWIILGMVFVVLAVALYMFALGIRAWWLGRRRYAASGRTLSLLALNLCEPLIGTVLVILFALTDIPWGISSLWTAWALSAPMLLMFAPIIYLYSRDQLYGARSKLLLALGLARWMITFFTLLSIFFAGLWLPLVALALCLLHIGLLCYAAFRGRRIFHELADVPPPSFPGFPELA